MKGKDFGYPQNCGTEYELILFKMIIMKRLLTLTAMFLSCMATSFAQFSGSG